MKILCWRDKEGRTGHGEPIEDELCDSWAEYMNGPRNSCRMQRVIPGRSRRSRSIEIIDSDTKYWSKPVDDTREEE